jgi:hypothetical protein
MSIKIVTIITNKWPSPRLFTEIPFKEEVHAVTCNAETIGEYPVDYKVKILKGNVGPLRAALSLEFEEGVFIVNDYFVNINCKDFWKCFYNDEPDVIVFGNNEGSLKCRVNSKNEVVKMASEMDGGIPVADNYYWKNGEEFVRYGAEALNKGGRTLWAAVNRAVLDCKKVKLLATRGDIE